MAQQQSSASQAQKSGSQPASGKPSSATVPKATDDKAQSQSQAKAPLTKEQKVKTLEDIGSEKENELNKLRNDLKKAQAEGKKWTTYTSIVMVLMISLLIAECTLTYKSY